uniref:Uncharacterized protein n=1 Tax=Knipowitschia caucasica TaxID=637954 RepID=A0AAV2M9J1_KNICA
MRRALDLYMARYSAVSDSLCFGGLSGAASSDQHEPFPNSLMEADFLGGQAETQQGGAIKMSDRRQPGLSQKTMERSESNDRTSEEASGQRRLESRFVIKI